MMTAMPDLSVPRGNSAEGSIRVAISCRSCDPVLCKQISDVLIDRYGIYVQPINYRFHAAPNGCGSRLRRTTAMPTSSIWCRLAEIWAEVGRAKAA
jgi:5-aminolevulinate synthase